MKYRGLELTGDVLTFQGVELCRLSATRLSAVHRSELEELVDVLTGPLGGMKADEVYEFFKEALSAREANNEEDDEGDE